MSSIIYNVEAYEDGKAAVAIRNKPNCRGSEVGDVGVVAPPYFHTNMFQLKAVIIYGGFLFFTLRVIFYFYPPLRIQR